MSNNRLTKKEINRLFIQGDRNLRQGNYTTAITIFEQLYNELEPSDRDYFNIQRSYNSLNINVEPYPKIDGFAICFEIELESEDWNDSVVEVATKGQRVALSWILYGNLV